MGLVANPLPIDLQLYDVLNEWKRKLLIEFNCHAIGTIQAFNAQTQTAQVTINYTKTGYNINPKSGQTTFTDYPYPILNGVPVVVLCGGSAYLNMPISPGDQCILLFNDRDYDNWAQGATTGAVNSARLHSLSDGIAIVGLKQLTKTISTYDSQRALISDGNVSVGINPSTHKATIKNTAEGTLNTLLQNLITAIQALQVTVSGSSFTAPMGGGPCTGTETVTINSSTALSSAATALQGLLE